MPGGLRFTVDMLTRNDGTVNSRLTIGEGTPANLYALAKACRELAAALEAAA